MEKAAEGKNLYNTARDYYGESNLAVFRVPMTEETVDSSLEKAFGEY